MNFVKKKLYQNKNMDKKYFKIRNVFVSLNNYQLNAFDVNSVYEWITSSKVLHNVIDYSVISFVALTNSSSSIDPNSFFPSKIKSSPHQQAYIEYTIDVVIPRFLENLYKKYKNDKHLFNDKELVSKCNEILQMFAAICIKRVSLIKKNEVYNYIPIIFSSTRIDITPDIGNCYFDSIHTCLMNNIGEDFNVRELISDQIVDSKKVGQRTKDYIGLCNKGQRFYDEYESSHKQFEKKFPGLLKANCTKGDQDCDQCVWGGEYLDVDVCNTIDTEMITFALHSYTSTKTVNVMEYLDDTSTSMLKEMSKEFAPHKTYEDNLMVHFDEPVVYNTHVSIKVSITVPTQDINHDEMPEDNYDEMSEDYYDEMSEDPSPVCPIGLVYSGAHINAVLWSF